IATMQPGDELVVWKLDRIGRNVLHALLMFQQLQEKGINFRSITDGVDLKTASGRYNFRNILSAAQYESDLNSERTLAGLAVARAKGRVGGRRPKFTDEQWREMGERMATGESRQSVSKTYGVGLSTLYKKFPAS
ncbi:recombinase family protein, partial [Escherichia coli]|nr:recombinase family protein [Escherichia coli]HAI2340826.1 recombinase family protein [Escherichia coli]